ncbi:hypothetical protein PoB_004722600 [Plakobranchus ocellatus]|uniref:Uncharacterized protein n=1 Tax=Plakobranchus ocellatus TaxID=259542 RepID=A0AAV4BJY4_9GAST|nr:hypothetical protein PoB_004722600 [Plakobranchus ocellatus]
MSARYNEMSRFQAIFTTHYRDRIGDCLDVIFLPLPSWAWGQEEVACAQSVANGTFIDIDAVQDDIKPYLRACWDVDGFVDCWQELKLGDLSAFDLNDTHDASDYLFPAPDDMRRAYYIFCARSFLQVVHEFTNSTDTAWCEYDTILAECSNFTDPVDLHRALKAQREKDPSLTKYFSCK